MLIHYPAMPADLGRMAYAADRSLRLLAPCTPC